MSPKAEFQFCSSPLRSRSHSPSVSICSPSACVCVQCPGGFSILLHHKLNYLFRCAMCETWAHISFWGPATFYDRKRNATRKRSEWPRAVQRGGRADLWLCQKLPKVCAKMHKTRGEALRWVASGLGQSNSQTAAEMYNKSRRQRVTGRMRRALKMQHYVYAVVHRRKSSQTQTNQSKATLQQWKKKHKINPHTHPIDNPTHSMFHGL